CQACPYATGARPRSRRRRRRRGQRHAPRASGPGPSARCGSDPHAIGWRALDQTRPPTSPRRSAMTVTTTPTTWPTGPGAPLDDATIARIDAWWRAANYLSVGQIYLLDNPMLRTELTRD